MLRSYCYRAYPTRAQEKVLREWLDRTREIYNAALQERRDAWNKQRVRISYFDQQHELAGVREECPEIAAVPYSVLRSAIRRTDRALMGFFRRCKAGQVPGFPRFKSAKRWQSIEFGTGRYEPLSKDGKRFKIPTIGQIKFKNHRPMPSKPKTVIMKLDRDGHWYVTFTRVDVTEKPLPKTGRVVGVDLGITTFATTSDAEQIANPRVFQSAQRETKRAQRRITRRRRGSARRRKTVALYAKRCMRLNRIKRQNHIDVARSLVERYDVICIEDLNFDGMARSAARKAIRDAGWGLFARWLACKAESAGREIIRVNPAGTSQNCSRCGCVVKKAWSVRVHNCPECGYVASRDENAAHNILAAGMAVRRGAPAVGGLQRPEKANAPPAHRPLHK